MAEELTPNEQNELIQKIGSIRNMIEHLDIDEDNILELASYSDAVLTHNFGYDPSSIENLRSDAEEIKRDN